MAVIVVLLSAPVVTLVDGKEHTMVAMIADPEGLGAPLAVAPGAEHEPMPAGPQEPIRVKAALTERVPCTNGCGNDHPPNKSGLCKRCWHASDWPRRNAMAKHGQGDPRYTDPGEQLRMITNLIRSTTRRALEEDPEEGLARMLLLAAHVQDAVRQVGLAKVEELGIALVAQGLGWTDQRVDERWGKARHRRRRYRAERAQ